MLGDGVAIALEGLLARPISYYISRDKQRRQQHQTRPSRNPFLCGIQLLYSSCAPLGLLPTPIMRYKHSIRQVSAATRSLK